MGVAYDFYTIAGAWVDSCESWQVAMLLPRLQAKFGDVTMVERGLVAEAAGDDFATWLMEI